MVRLLLDTMLGTLAKWLRAAGVDTAYMPHADDDELLRISKEEGRALLTRDRALVARAPAGTAFLIPDGPIGAQLRFVIERFGLTLDARLTRCLLCNALLEHIEKEKVEGRVPEGVFGRHGEFWRCPKCEKIYWPATHYQDMARRLQAFFAGASE